MNRWQDERQIRYLLGKAVWPDAPGDKILKRVIITSRPVDEFALQLPNPFATVYSIEADPDQAVPAHANVARFRVAIVAQNVSDRYGEGALVGANRVSLGSSPGRGVDEILEELQKTFLLGALTPVTDSLKAIQGYVQRVGELQSVVDAPGLVQRSFDVFVYNVNTSRFYHNGFNLVGTAGAQQASFTWASPPDRFDLVGVKLIRKPGATAPTSPSDGTDLGIGLAATSYVDVVGSSGQFSWALFGIYDEWSATPVNVQRWSTGLPVTLTI